MFGIEEAVIKGNESLGRRYPTTSTQCYGMLKQMKSVVKGHVNLDWLITAIVCLLEKDEQLITRLFKTEQYCAEGVYRLALFVQGRW